MALGRNGTRDPRGVRAGGTGNGPSIAQLSRSLRVARVRQGLTVSDAGTRAGLSGSDVDTLESGDLRRLSDRIATVRALRQYADTLGLPGEELALALTDAWPPVLPGGVSAALDDGSAGAWSGPHRAGGAAPVASAEASAVTTGIDHITASVPTSASLQDLGPWNAPTLGGRAALPFVTGQMGSATGRFEDTGVVPAAPPRRAMPHRRHRTARAVLWGLLVVLVVLVVVAGGWLAVDHWRPRWLKDAGLPYTHTSQVLGSPGAPAPTVTTLPAPLSVTQTGSNSGTADVRRPGVSVRVDAVGGPSWVQVSDTTHANPIFASVLQSGASQSFPVSSGLTIQTGSSAAHFTFVQGTTVIGRYTPGSAPYTMAVKPTS